MSAIHWFEIPAADFDRARAFYEKVLDCQLFINDQRETMGSMLGVFPHEGGIGGCLVHNPGFGYTPSDAGTLVYLRVVDDLDAALGRVPDAGGAVLLPKTQLGDDAGGGFVAWIADSEGNKVGFYSDE